MADPLTVVGAAASVVQLIHFTTKLLTRLNDYRVIAGEFPSTFAHIASQLPLLQHILEETQEGIQLQNISQEDVNVIRPCLQGCQQQMQKLETLLLTILPEAQERKARKYAKGLRSLWKDSDVRKIAAEIDFFVTRLNFYCSWSSSKLDPRNQDVLVAIQRRLAPPDPFLDLRKALKLRSTNTGQWYLEGAQFEAYKAESSSFVWLCGSAGSGKTILCASIIDSLQQFCSKDPARSLAFFFFDFNDAAKQDPDIMVKSLLSQCLERCTKIPNAAKCLSITASEQQILDALRDTMEALPMPFVILDALDECKNRERLFEILEEMQSWGNKSLHVTVTSRKEVEIDDALEDLVLPKNKTCLESHLVDEDIRTYVHERLTQDKAFRRWQREPDIQEEIEQTLGKQACGIQSGEEALKILRWLAHSRRPLSAEELLEVTGIFLEEGYPHFDKDEVLKDLRDVLRICFSLVSIIPAAQNRDTGGDESQTEHSLSPTTNTSVEPEGDPLFSASAEGLYPAVRAILEDESVDIDTTWGSLGTALCEASRFGYERVVEMLLAKGANANVHQGGLALVEATRHGETKIIEMLLHAGADVHAAQHPYGTALDVAAGNGDQKTMQLLLTKDANLEAREQSYGHALVQASMFGHAHVAESLLANGADPDVRRPHGDTALAAASLKSHAEAVEILLAHGADANAQSSTYGTALAAASFVGSETSERIVEMLLVNGADVEARGVGNLTPLQLASYKGNAKIVQILLAHGADVNAQPGWHGSALRAASIGEHQEIVQMLQAQGATLWEGEREEITATLVRKNDRRVAVADLRRR
ncbi:hypothetical protein KC354_g14537 [Hortaea werneckii]|nr:hypothetical protein KC354_g14537 [Hortaea werneckii]